jgi:hypothetical protein
MDKIDFKHLELLLGKISIELNGQIFCIIPNYIHDGCYIATYKENGEVDKQIIAVDIEDALMKLNNKK